MISSLSGLDGKEFACNAGGLDSIPGSERSPGGRNGNPLQYSCLENPMNRGTSWAIAYHVLCPWASTGKNTGLGRHSLLQGIFLTQESNLGLLHYRQNFYHLSHQGSPVPNLMKTLLLKPTIYLVEKLKSYFFRFMNKIIIFIATLVNIVLDFLIYTMRKKK